MGGNARHANNRTRTRAAPHAAAQRVRLQRVLAAAGIGARRACEALIEEGHVQVNGKTINRLPAFVDPEGDRITVDGRPIARPQKPVWLMLNKPARVLSTTDDEAGRTTIMDLVTHPARLRLFPVGRLDFETTGLVLLTNDGETANKLTHPRYGVPRTYRAEVKGTLDASGLASLQKELIKQQRKDDKRAQRESGRVRPTPAGLSRIELAITGREPGRTIIHITLREGRTGNIASMLAGAGANVRKLERIAIGPVLLTGVAGGRWRELERHEVRALKAAAMGKRFEPEPLRVRPAPPPSSLPETVPVTSPRPMQPRRREAKPEVPSRRKPRTIA
jgi:23S rRNA pseudouridine2605 synthase